MRTRFLSLFFLTVFGLSARAETDVVVIASAIKAKTKAEFLEKLKAEVKGHGLEYVPEGGGGSGGDSVNLKTSAGMAAHGSVTQDHDYGYLCSAEIVRDLHVFEKHETEFNKDAGFKQWSDNLEASIIQEADSRAKELARKVGKLNLSHDEETRVYKLVYKEKLEPALMGIGSAALALRYGSNIKVLQAALDKQNASGVRMRQECPVIHTETIGREMVSIGPEPDFERIREIHAFYVKPGMKNDRALTKESINAARTKIWSGVEKTQKRLDACKTLFRTLCLGDDKEKNKYLCLLGNARKEYEYDSSCFLELGLHAPTPNMMGIMVLPEMKQDDIKGGGQQPAK